MTRALTLLLVVACCGTPRAGTEAGPPPSPPSPPPVEPSPPRPPATPTRPTAVDATLPVPDNSTVLGTDADGRALLSITAPTPDRSLRYYAVLDPRHECFEQTQREDALMAAASAETDADALARLQDAGTLAELGRLRELARPFGVRALGPAVFGGAGDAVVVQAHDHAYVIANGRVARVPGGSALVHAMSPDGHWVALGQCAARCRGMYVPTLLDVATGQVRVVGTGNLTSAFFAPDGSLYVVTEDRAAHADGNRQVCVARLPPSEPRTTNLHCATSGTTSWFSTVTSARVLYLGVKVLDPQANEGRLLVVALPGGEVRRTIGAEPMVASVSDDGRAAWDDAHGPGNTWRAHLVTDAGERLVPGAKAAGFLADGTLLLHTVRPAPAPTTLATGFCGAYSTLH